MRIAVIGASPCRECDAACCRQNGHEYAALLQGEAERRRFAAFSVMIPVNTPGGVVSERVLPYIAGRCQFLGSDDRCTIYEDRPRACRDFECVKDYNRSGVGRHGEFLGRNPRVLAMLEALPA